MTDTTSAAPSDAEIDALDDQFRWDTTQGRRDYARAVLARWGAPQPVARMPLTLEAINAMAREHSAEDLCGWSYRMGIADAERHHGIKGGQHGTE